MESDSARSSRASKAWQASLGALALAAACNVWRLPPDPRDAWHPERLAPSAPNDVWQPDSTTEEHLRASMALANETKQHAGGPETSAKQDLPALIDVALTANPTTREAWERSRAAAARYGESLAAYYPRLEAGALVSPNARFLEAGESLLVVRQDSYEPALRLTYTLLDFGRSAQSAAVARERLLAASFAFNRQLQDVVFGVQGAYYRLDAAQALQRAAEQNVALARTVLAAADARLDVGLATKPEQLLAKQAEARAIYELENARVAVHDAVAELALAVGSPANRPLRIESLFDEPVPPDLDREVDALIDQAIADRPDLAARLAELRAAEAAVERARAEFFPSVGFRGAYGEQAWDYTANGGPRQRTAQPAYSTIFTFDWSIFTGFERQNALRAAESEASAARAELEAAELDVIAEVWRAYYDYRAAVRKVTYAEDLLRASRDAYAANLETYKHGLSNIVDLLTAERDLANARYIRVQSRAELLVDAARIAHAAGAWHGTP